MNPINKTILTSLTIGTLTLSASASITALTPVSILSSSSFNDTLYDESNLADGNLATLTVGTESGLGDDFAGSGSGPHTIVFDFGSEFTFDKLFFAQRNNTGSATLDDTGSINLWFLNSDPGAATVSLPSTLGVADQSFSPDTRDSELEEFSLSNSGRYVVAEIIAASGATGNIGAAEFRLSGVVTAVPEPSSSILLGLGSLGLLFRRRR